MIRKLLFLLLIPLFISCTVTKRVHRPGFHVQWNKVQRTQKASKLESTIKESQRPNYQDEILLEVARINEISNNEIAPVLISESPEINALKAVVQRDESKTISHTHKIISEHFHPRIKAENSSIYQNSQSPIFWRTPPENSRKLGIALMIIGGIILWGSILAFAGAFSGNGSGGWLNFFFDLIDLSGWFWLLFFILAIILVSYLSFLFVLHVLGGPIVGLIVGLGILGVGLFFYILGKRRVPEPPN